MNNYNSQRAWSDSYIPQVNKILYEVLPIDDSFDIKVTSDEIDMKEAADLAIVGHGQEIRIALRLRKQKYMKTYPYDFTIRYEYTDGYKTEFEKIAEGHADLMFYGFVDGKSIIRYLFLDLDQVREEINELYIVYEENPNNDGINKFRGYDIRSFKNENLIIATSDGFFDLKELMIPKSDGTGHIGSRIFKGV